MPLTTFAPGAPNITSVTEGITALAGGGQTNATQLASRYNRVTTVASAADSVALPPYTADLMLFVSNDGSNSMNVFPYSGQQINAGAVNAAFAVAAGKTAIFIGSGTSGKWAAVLSA